MPRNRDDFLESMRYAHSYGTKSFAEACEVIKINCSA